MFSFIRNLFKSKPLPPFPTDSVVWSSDPKTGIATGVVIGPNKILTARHYYTPIGTKIHINLKDGSAFETVIVKKTTPDVQVVKTIPLADNPKNDRYWYGDVAICEVQDTFPIQPLEIKDFSGGMIFVQHKDEIWKEHIVGIERQWGTLSDFPSWIRTLWGKDNFKQGDSGLPWFSLDKKTNKWTIVGITSRTSIDPIQTPWSGESPRLGSKKFKDVI